MESHGKQYRHGGKAVDYVTGGVVWGGVGTNGQHTFHQLLHQGTHLIPVDFIIATHKSHDLLEHHQALVANCLSQSQALMRGKTAEEILQELLATGVAEATARELLPHKVIPGNRPSNTIVLPELTPFNLGALIALYEHKIFIQSAIWDINCFDQWGVELGKELANSLLQSIQKKPHTTAFDSSTAGLVEHFHKLSSPSTTNMK
jgi:glucose-6-phosphate isomerase